MNSYERFLKPLLFAMDAETAHNGTIAALELAGRFPGAARRLRALCRREDPALETTVAGLRFPNPVGLAAGFDKDCRAAAILPAFGFGFIELGTVTPRPQPGNPRPRVFRIPEAMAVLNRLGFPSEGAAAAAERLKAAPERPIPVGINLGMNAETPPEKAADDYAEAFSKLNKYGDYFVVNVSSPNTGGLRDLQERWKLERILTRLRPVNPAAKPVFVKLSPDLEPARLTDLLPMLMEESQGLVIGNSTLSREGVSERWLELRGGLSGAPLKDRATALISAAYGLTRGALPIIGAGGIMTAEDAYQKLRAGASLVQLYTGLIYRGPGLAREINDGLLRLLASHQLPNVASAVGLSHPEVARK